MADVKISGLPASTTPLAGTEVLPIVQSGVTKQVSVANLTTGRAINVSGLTNTALTSGRITYATTGGQLTDNAGLTYATDRVTVTHAGATRLQLTNSTASNNVQLTAGATNSSLNSINGYQWEIQTANSTKLTVDNSSNVTVNLGNLIIGTSGKGIDFSATAGTGTSELLADYEEGTWTPQLSDGTNTVNGTTTCKYRKVGSLVYVDFEFYNKNISGFSGGMRLANLPFANASATTWGCFVGSTTATNPIHFNGSNGNTYMILYLTFSTADPVALQKTAFTSETNMTVWGQLCYVASAT
jgi:predicted secreted protein